VHGLKAAEPKRQTASTLGPTRQARGASQTAVARKVCLPLIARYLENDLGVASTSEMTLEGKHGLKVLLPAMDKFQTELLSSEGWQRAVFHDSNRKFSCKQTAIPS
jgi:hypothetical protein